MKKIVLILFIMMIILSSGCSVSKKEEIIHVNSNMICKDEGIEFRINLINDDGTVDLDFLKKEMINCSKLDISSDMIKEILKIKENDDENYISMVYFADTEGNFYASEEMDLGDYDPRTRPWYKTAMEEGIYISSLYTDAFTGDRLISFSIKIESETVLGVLGYDYIVSLGDENK